jgi:GDPmannose 4,6-dehydratase
MQKKALITGITGQDGCYLAKFLLGKDYQVIGVVRPEGNSDLNGLKYLKILDDITLMRCDLLNQGDVFNLISKFYPDEIYNLSAQSSVGESFQNPYETINFNITSVLNLLETLRILSDKRIKFYQASSSEMYGKVPNLPVKENSVIHPLSPYAVSKATNHFTTINYREAFGIFSCCGILFNHESFLRSEKFFVKKVIRDSILIAHGKKNVLRVGNIDVKRDFGFGPKYIEAMWFMLQQNEPDDYIICSGRSVSLKEIIYWVFNYFSISKERLVIEDSLIRPNELFDMFGDNSKARKILGWNYNFDFFEVLNILIKEELENFHEADKCFL